MSAASERVGLAGTAELEGPLRRSRLLRLGLAAALLALFAGALWLAVQRPGLPSLLPEGSDGVIVLDVSGSIGPRDYRQLAQALDEANSEKRRYGLVVFSDLAYEVFPPGSHPGQLRAVRRFFVPARETRHRLGTTRVGRRLYPASPWSVAFTGGTLISRGLDLASRIIERDALRDPAVLLISDLTYDPKDVGAIERALASFRRNRIPLRVVALAPAGRTTEFFDTFEDAARVGVAQPVTSVVSRRSSEAASTTAPLLLAGTCLLLLALLAANELACGRLSWAPGGTR
jgi:hypothetical protein